MDVQHLGGSGDVAAMVEDHPRGRHQGRIRLLGKHCGTRMDV